MAKSEVSKTRKVVEFLTHFDLSEASSFSVSSPPSFSSLAISTASDSSTLIYVGTNSGAILLLSLTPNSSPPPSSSLVDEKVKLLRFVSVSTSTVDSIHVVSEMGKILVVSDGNLYLVNSSLLPPVKKLAFVKGVSVLARRVRSGLSGAPHLLGKDSASTSQSFLRKLGGGIRSNGAMKDLDLNRDANNCIFAVATGKKLTLMEAGEGERGEGSFVIWKEILGVEGVKAMTWVDNSIIIGTASGYSLVSCVSGKNGLIFSLPDGASSPYIKLLPRDHKVLLLVDNVGIVANSEGQPVSGSLVFSGAPDAIEELSSYIVVAKKNKMELYHRKSGTCIQALPFSANGHHRCALAADDNGNLITVAKQSKVLCYQKIPSEEQIKDLLRVKNIKDAVSLAEELESDGEITKEILFFVHAQVGFLLLFDLHFEKAVDHFLQSSTMLPSELFPFIMRDPNRWSLLVPRNRYWGLHPPPSHIQDVVEDGLLSIQRAIFLRKAGVETDVYDEFLKTPPRRDDLLESASKNFIRYLEASRCRELSPPVLEGVDTLLMYLYRTLNCTDDMERLACSKNSCLVYRRSWKVCWRNQGT